MLNLLHQLVGALRACIRAFFCLFLVYSNYFWKPCMTAPVYLLNILLVLAVMYNYPVSEEMHNYLPVLMLSNLINRQFDPACVSFHELAGCPEN
jgi:small basic protein